MPAPLRRYQRNLPHIHPVESVLFMTDRLAGSIPREVAQRIKVEERMALEIVDGSQDDPVERKALKLRIRKKIFAKYDRYLDDRQVGPVWLEDRRIAGVVAGGFHQTDKVGFDLIAYTIMPNHTHYLIRHIRDDVSLFKITGKMKHNTAKAANEILSRSGFFWQHETFDHVVRSNQSYFRIIEYIALNPVKAGLARRWQDWPYTYIKSNIDLARCGLKK